MPCTATAQLAFIRHAATQSGTWLAHSRSAAAAHYLPTLPQRPTPPRPAGQPRQPSRTLPAQCVPSLLEGLMVNQSRSEALLISMYLISACSSCSPSTVLAGNREAGEK